MTCSQRRLSSTHDAKANRSQRGRDALELRHTYTTLQRIAYDLH